MEIYTIQHPSVLDALSRDGYFRPPTDKSMDNTDGYFGYRLCYRWMIDRLYEKCGLPLGVSQEQYDKARRADDELFRAGWKMIEPADDDGFPHLAMSDLSPMPHPVWGFQKVYGKPHAKPDMRSWLTDAPEEVVRLRLDIPEDRMLFSDLEYWHIPLNMGYLPQGEGDVWDADDEAFDERCRRAAENIGVKIDNGNGLFSEKIDHLFDVGENAEIAGLQQEFLDSWRNCLVDVNELGSVEESVSFRELEWNSRETQCVFWEIREEDVKGVEYFTTRAAGKR